MSIHTRREILVLAASSAVLSRIPPALASDAELFIAAAAQMRQQAVAAGDQPYGAILVLNGNIIGFGPSRVVTDRNPDAHAERVALWDAQRRLGANAIPGSVIYATSTPCSICQKALAQAEVTRMYVGASGVDNGNPGAR